ncbi:SDR family oxidoreductase [Amycolatopsis sp. K13G38]|uniref:SDR family oxidoreductase n=1 Tax=Amycolatopsis acididurans TaxID=2724524 RepID=A0ABX1J8B9_9PSEU|nr:SDR family NAD(P)-dependent oxidoreductase [Amycolatopsis acididurans]NKQ55804.1 SDR family oxidoreductase [Amycolatopsis acididurans]
MSAVVVTGAAQGIGAAIGERFARGGYTVFGVDLREDLMRERVQSWPGTHVAVGADVTDEDAMRDVCARAGQDGLAAFVANAGHAKAGTSVDYAREDWDKMLAVHVTGAFVGARQAVTAGAQSVVMVSSVNGATGFPGRTAYGAAKAGVAGLVRGLAVEWATRGVRVNAIAPGSIRTELSAEFIRRGVIDENEFLARIPMRRFGRPEEVAELAFFLGTPVSSYITGTVIPIDGGWLAQGIAAQE